MYQQSTTTKYRDIFILLQKIIKNEKKYIKPIEVQKSKKKYQKFKKYTQSPNFLRK